MVSCLLLCRLILRETVRLPQPQLTRHSIELSFRVPPSRSPAYQLFIELWVSSHFQLVLRTTADARCQSPARRQHRADQRPLPMNHPESRVTRALVMINALLATLLPDHRLLWKLI